MGLQQATHPLAIARRRHLYRQNAQQGQHQALMERVFSLDLPTLVGQALAAHPRAMVADQALAEHQPIAQQGQRLNLMGPVWKAARHLSEAAANTVTLTPAGMLNSLRVTRRLHPQAHMAMDQVEAMARQITFQSASNLNHNLIKTRSVKP